MSPHPTTSHGPFGCVVLAPSTSVNRPPVEASGRAGCDTGFSDRLADWLCFMVPMFIAEMRHWSPEDVSAARADALDQIAHHGDDLQFGGKHRKSSRTGLAKGIAILARAEGGVTALGVHACTVPHVGCPGRPPAPAAA